VQNPLQYIVRRLMFSSMTGAGDADDPAGDDPALAAPAVSFPNDIVLEDKTVVQEERQEQRLMQNASRTVQSRAPAASAAFIGLSCDGQGCSCCRLAFPVQSGG